MPELLHQQSAPIVERRIFIFVEFLNFKGRFHIFLICPFVVFIIFCFVVSQFTVRIGYGFDAMSMMVSFKLPLSNEGFDFENLSSQALVFCARLCRLDSCHAPLQFYS
ncbi:MAG: hypothetical protein WDM76_17715 [Limisphaerales bacterium]